jgi:hypothetical protein
MKPNVKILNHNDNRNTPRLADSQQKIIKYFFVASYTRNIHEWSIFRTVLHVMWHPSSRLNIIDTILIPPRYTFFSESSTAKNFGVKRVWLRAISRWVTDRKVCDPMRLLGVTTIRPEVDEVLHVTMLIWIEMKRQLISIIVDWHKEGCCFEFVKKFKGS